MEHLRLWLLAGGGVFIALIYLWGRHQERRREAAAALLRPSLDEELDLEGFRAERSPVSIDELEPLRATETEPPVLDEVAVAAPVQPPVQELIVTLGIMAPRGRTIEGSLLADAFHQAGLSYGEMNIFHAPVDLERPDGPALFSVANAVEPGTLEPEKLRLLETPGLVMFARLPGPVKGLEVFEHMQATARFLAGELGAEVCDERRQPLTPEAVAKLRERIIASVGDAIRRPER